MAVAGDEHHVWIRWVRREGAVKETLSARVDRWSRDAKGRPGTALVCRAEHAAQCAAGIDDIGVNDVVADIIVDGEQNSERRREVREPVFTAV